MKDKVIGLSLARSGTQSLAKLLSFYQYKTVHWIDSRYENQSLSIKTKDDLCNFVELFEKDYDAFTDITFSILYDFFHIKYPDAKFILITRDKNDFLNSVKRHILAHEKMGISNKIHPIANVVFNQYISLNHKHMKEVTDEQLIHIYDSHNEAVLNYFKDSKNFIHLDLNDKNLSEKISTFLNTDSVNKFPWVDFAKNV